MGEGTEGGGIRALPHLLLTYRRIAPDAILPSQFILNEAKV